MRFFSDLTRGISQKRREHIEQRKREIRRRFSVFRLADGKLYKFDGNLWVETEPKIDLNRLDQS